jgi:hypothetical protein
MPKEMPSDESKNTNNKPFEQKLDHEIKKTEETISQLQKRHRVYRQETSTLDFSTNTYYTQQDQQIAAWKQMMLRNHESIFHPSKSEPSSIQEQAFLLHEKHTAGENIPTKFYALKTKDPDSGSAEEDSKNSLENGPRTTYTLEYKEPTQKITETLEQERNNPQHNERVKQIKNLDFNTLQAVRDNTNNYTTKQNLDDNVKEYYKNVRDLINKLFILREDNVLTQNTMVKLKNKYPDVKESQAIAITDALYDNMKKIDTYTRENKQTKGGAKRLEEFNTLLAKMENITNPD